MARLLIWEEESMATKVTNAALIAELPNLLAIAQEQRAEIARLTKLCERLEEEW